MNRLVFIVILFIFLFLFGCGPKKNSAPVNFNSSSGPLTVSVVPSSPRSLDKVRINVVDTGTGGAAKVAVSLDMTSMSMPQDVVHAVSDGNGHYHADVQFTMPGVWEVTATVQRPNNVYDYTTSVTVQ